jgi:hypothetical protein
MLRTLSFKTDSAQLSRSTQQDTPIVSLPKVKIAKPDRL